MCHIYLFFLVYVEVLINFINVLFPDKDSTSFRMNDIKESTLVGDRPGGAINIQRNLVSISYNVH